MWLASKKCNYWTIFVALSTFPHSFCQPLLPTSFSVCTHENRTDFQTPAPKITTLTFTHKNRQMTNKQAKNNSLMRQKPKKRPQHQETRRQDQRMTYKGWSACRCSQWLNQTQKSIFLHSSTSPLSPKHWFICHFLSRSSLIIKNFCQNKRSRLSLILKLKDFLICGLLLRYP